MKTDRVRRAAARDEETVTRLRDGKLAFEPEHERVDPLVRDEDVRAEPDREHVKSFGRGPAERLFEVGDALRSSEVARRPADPDRRQASERHVLLDVHASSARRSGTPSSTSPAPIVSTTSPARARPARNRAPSSTLGVQPTVMPGRASVAASTTSLPLTPSTGSS